ncbi:hypothetical protein [Streptomyces sp. NBC_00467]|uniref:hypothetical protein n=1 Tax=Streptomyces sp. NBC_00467 TaxID=2975752 RepID=UPI002E1702A7
MAEASGGGQPVADHGDPGPATGSHGDAPADLAPQDPADSDVAATAATASASTRVEIGRGVGAVITVIAALAGLILGVRAEQRADREEKRAAGLSQKAFAEQVDFYRTPSAVVVMNGNPHPTEMRLLLPGRLWWDLRSLEPCKQIKIPTGSLRASLRDQLPSVQVTDEELSSLWLEFQDPDGRSWARTGGGALAPSTWKPVSLGVHMVDLRESWNKAPEDSPICGAP